MEGLTENGQRGFGSTTTASGGNRRTAFTRGYTPNQSNSTDNGTGGRIVAETQTNGVVSTSTSDEGTHRFDPELQSENGRIIDTNRDNSPTDSIDVGGNERAEVGSVGVGGSVETPRRQRGRPEGKYGKYNKSSSKSTDNDNGFRENSNSIIDGGVQITVESAAIMDDEPADVVPTTEKKARVRKPKDPPKGKVEEVSASLKDIYQIVDMVTESAIKVLGKGELYPKDLMCLDDDVAQRLARNLVQLNDAMPKVAAKFNTVSVPAMLVSTLATDLLGKGVMLYAIVKSPNVR